MVAGPPRKLECDESIEKHLPALRIVSDARLRTAWARGFSSFLRYLPAVRKINLARHAGFSSRQKAMRQCGQSRTRPEPKAEWHPRDSVIHLVFQSERYQSTSEW